MSTQYLSCGVQHSILQNVIYALPVKKCNIQSADLCQLSPVTTTTSFADVTATTTGVESGTGFIRCTGGNTTVWIKEL